MTGTRQNQLDGDCGVDGKVVDEDAVTLNDAGFTGSAAAGTAVGVVAFSLRGCADADAPGDPVGGSAQSVNSGSPKWPLSRGFRRDAAVEPEMLQPAAIDASAAAPAVVRTPGEELCVRVVTSTGAECSTALQHEYS